MKRLVRQIVQPGWPALVVYGVLSFIVLVFGVWRASLVGDFTSYEDSVSLVPTAFDGFFFLLFPFVVLFGFLLVLAVATYRTWNWKLYKYGMITVAQLMVILWLAGPIQEWQVSDSMKRGSTLASAIETYHQQVGQYPQSLGELSASLRHSVPQRATVGTPFRYERIESDHYHLSFDSYHGETGVYDADQKKWAFPKDGLSDD